ncbi:MAG: hypothetical protein ACXW4T_02875 [Candidatus Limnocylindrales bacterium]
MTDPGSWRAHVSCVDLSLRLCRVERCRLPLPPRRTAYCSERHAREFARNHVWPDARRAARRRAGWACEQCGFKSSAIRRDPVERRRYARHELRLEVNHKVPLLGAYRMVSCGNHQANLEVLCHACHVIATASQRSVRLVGGREGSIAAKATAS